MMLCLWKLEHVHDLSIFVSVKLRNLLIIVSMKVSHAYVDNDLALVACPFL